MNIIDNHSDLNTINFLSKSIKNEILEKALDHSGLVQKEIQYKTKNGKIATRKQWVRVGEEQKSTVTSHSSDDSKKGKRKQLPITPYTITENTKHLVEMDTVKDIPDHIKKLNIPPTYRNVMISMNPDADILAIGKDDMDRTHYTYNPKVVQKNTQEKFHRVNKLMYKKKELTEFIQGIDDKDTSDCLMLILKMGIRPGSTRNTRSKVEAIGATTLRGEHVITEGDKVFLRFIGKKGVPQDHEVTDEYLKTVLVKRKESAGDKGDLFNTTDAKLRKTLKIFGDIKVKDLRTMLATSVAQSVLQDTKSAENTKDFMKIRNHVGDVVSNILGNQRTMALSSYINPEVFEKWSPDIYLKWNSKQQPSPA